MTRVPYLTIPVAFLALLLDVGPAAALPTKVVHQDLATCDPLFIPDLVDEVGNAQVGFPQDETLLHGWLGDTDLVVCPQTDDPAVPNHLVEIINTSGRDFVEVWYVADPETRISNVDGLANDAGIATGPTNLAFRIDNKISDPTGMHQPLILESMTQDNIWEAGEVWQFVLQDYSNSLNLPPDAFTSLGIGNASHDIAGFLQSSGSIIAIPSKIPEPATGILMLAGTFAAAVALRYRWG